MKTKYLLSFLLCVMLSIPSAEAQFFKKLKKKAENAAERTVLNKTDREVSKTTDKTIDGVIKGGNETNKGEPEIEKEEPTDEQKQEAEKSVMSIFGGSLEGLPDTYEFQYVMDMKLTTKKDEMEMKYYIQPNATYFGNAIADERATSVIVYDMENQAMVTFMDNGTQKMAMKTRMPFDDAALKEMAKNDTNQEDIDITPLPSKTILGYHCRGYQIEQKDGVSKFYITNEAPVSFVGVFSSIEQMPKSGYNATIPFDENSMIMEMEYISNKRKRDNMHMICTKLEKDSITISKSEYKIGL
ncbi:uncharacterized protein DUF4412 [Ulvibacter sp. MAR_2010_11]|uniref:DUF4412 domain-containing protein n=1 Tax=Ulvibacter sp. MAR_2010_11 TaxID=1250229 RepID=UPI000CAF0F09|nr:DUF4412 domain-containing protein [Ulvibacter sp. MAR_2010_11]PKA84470.1 uncharacterized protein DUF4412 [Ulvibacter sp. MAR_2010_11]